jgi:hypothetical protein
MVNGGCLVIEWEWTTQDRSDRTNARMINGECLWHEVFRRLGLRSEKYPVEMVSLQ